MTVSPTRLNSATRRTRATLPLPDTRVVNCFIDPTPKDSSCDARCGRHAHPGAGRAPASADGPTVGDWTTDCNVGTGKDLRFAGDPWPSTHAAWRTPGTRTRHGPSPDSGSWWMTRSS